MEPDGNPYKIYVNVCAEFNADGSLIPLSFVWENGTRYTIDRVTDVRLAASLKAGGIGMRYTCRVRGRLTYLFLDDNRWFMERKGV